MENRRELRPLASHVLGGDELERADSTQVTDVLLAFVELLIYFLNNCFAKEVICS